MIHGLLIQTPKFRAFEYGNGINGGQEERRSSRPRNKWIEMERNCFICNCNCCKDIFENKDSFKKHAISREGPFRSWNIKAVAQAELNDASLV